MLTSTPSSQPAISQRRIVIGDVHGHYDTLNLLLEAIAPNSEDQVYFLGDLIDRGPQSSQVVDFVMRHKYHCILGNHEHMLLETVGKGDVNTHQLQGWLYGGGYSTLVSYDHQIPQEHINWMKAHGVTSRLKSKSRAVFLCYPTLNNCRQPESLLRMNDNDNHLQMGGEDVAFATSSPPKQGNRIKI